MRIIGHLDMDAFFAAIEERNRSRLKGLPIVVGADPDEGRGRGVVSTANYKAREYGIHSAMPISKAWQLSEKAKKSGKHIAIFINGNYGRYSEVSEKIMNIVKVNVPLVEEASIDEAYLDLSFTGSFKNAEKLVKKIKKAIKGQEKLTCSIGIGTNKLIAKIASDYKKPDSITLVTEKQAEKFLEPMRIRKIPGIGPKAENILKRRGINFIKDLKIFSQGDLYELFGEWGLEIYEKIRGRDSSLIIKDYEIKSIGEQETFLKDTIDPNFIYEKLGSLCKNVILRLENSEFNSFRTMVVTIRFEDFQTRTRSYTFKKVISNLKTFQFESFKILAPFLDKRENPKHKLIRLVGVRIEKLN